MSKTEPSHYDGANGAKLIDITQNCDFVLGNVIKYAFRAGKKDGESSIDDLRKAHWYLHKAISMEKNCDAVQSFKDWVRKCNENIGVIEDLHVLADATLSSIAWYEVQTDGDWSLHSTDEVQYEDGIYLQFGRLAIVPGRKMVEAIGRKREVMVYTVFDSDSRTEHGQVMVELSPVATVRRQDEALATAAMEVLKEDIRNHQYASQENQDESQG